MSTTSSLVEEPGGSLETVETRARIPFSRLLRVEFRKSYDTKASFWLLAVIVLIVIVAETIALLVTTLNSNADHMKWSSFASVAGFLTSVLLPVLGIMLVTSEWSQRGAMTTFSLEPRRGKVVWAKLLVGYLLAVLTLVGAMIIGAVANVIYGAATGSIDWGDFSPHGLGLLGFFLYQLIDMTLGFAVATLLLSTPAAIVVFFLFTFLLPTLLAIGSNLMHWFKDFAPWINFSDAVSNVADWGVISGDRWGQLAVNIVLWLLIPFVIGLRRILRAEVK